MKDGFRFWSGVGLLTLAWFVFVWLVAMLWAWQRVNFLEFYSNIGQWVPWLRVTFFATTLMWFVLSVGAWKYSKKENKHG